MGTFRIAKLFEVATGHRLSKHPEKCRFPHGHTRSVEVVLRASDLDDHDMVCDYAVLKRLVGAEVERFDHAMVLGRGDPLLGAFAPFSERVVVIDDGDPTTEILARHLFRRIRDLFQTGSWSDELDGTPCAVRKGVVVERVRVWETPSTWAEYEEGD